MGLRFRKSIKILPGVRLNLSRRGASVSAHAGPVTVNSRGRVSVDLPGPFSYVHEAPHRRRSQ